MNEELIKKLQEALSNTTIIKGLSRSVNLDTFAPQIDFCGSLPIELMNDIYIILGDDITGEMFGKEIWKQLCDLHKKQEAVI